MGNRIVLIKYLKVVVYAEIHLMQEGTDTHLSVQYWTLSQFEYDDIGPYSCYWHVALLISTELFGSILLVPFCPPHPQWISFRHWGEVSEWSVHATLHFTQYSLVTIMKKTNLFKLWQKCSWNPAVPLSCELCLTNWEGLRDIENDPGAY